MGIFTVWLRGQRWLVAGMVLLLGFGAGALVALEEGGEFYDQRSGRMEESDRRPEGDRLAQFGISDSVPEADVALSPVIPNASTSTLHARYRNSRFGFSVGHPQEMDVHGAGLNLQDPAEADEVQIGPFYVRAIEASDLPAEDHAGRLSSINRQAGCIAETSDHSPVPAEQAFGSRTFYVFETRGCLLHLGAVSDIATAVVAVTNLRSGAVVELIYNDTGVSPRTDFANFLASFGEEE